VTLKIKPVKLRQSVYFRVPNDIADLIGLQPNAEVILSLEEEEDRYLLTYSVTKPLASQGALSFRRRRTETPLEPPAAIE
jgi:hypothetical protein